MRKIALIIDIWEPLTGGSQTHVHEIAFGLVQEYGFEIDIFTRALCYESRLYDKEEELIPSRLRIIRVGPFSEPINAWGRLATLWTVARRLWGEHKKKEYDLIHAHSILGGAMGKLASLMTKKPLLFTVHGCPNMDGGRKNFDFYAEKFILTKLRYDKVISVGKSYLSYPNVNRDVEVIPNGVDVARFDAVAAKKPDAFKILFVGRLDWVKGIDTLLEALMILRENHRSLLEEKKVKVHLIGYGFDRHKYETLARVCHLDDLVTFRGRMTGKALVEEYKSSRLFVLPSRCEGQPVTLLEAMAARLPILTTFAADNAGIVTPALGWKVRERSSEAIAESLVSILKTPESRLAEMGERGYEVVSRDLTWDEMVRKTYKVYDHLLNKGGAVL